MTTPDAIGLVLVLTFIIRIDVEIAFSWSLASTIQIPPQACPSPLGIPIQYNAKSDSKINSKGIFHLDIWTLLCYWIVVGCSQR